MKVRDGNREGPGRKVQQETYRRWPARVQVRVKWWGKSPPRRGQPERHCKPRVVQDRTGEGLPARQSPGISRTPRKRGASLRRSERNDRTVPRKRDGQNPAYRGAAIFFSERFADSETNEFDGGNRFACRRRLSSTLPFPAQIGLILDTVFLSMLPEPESSFCRWCGFCP